uniref:Polygalacturonase n=1 Tax=Aegilops tauschii subsp. strangulata TaxID=200361 RepID=A0A452ZQJ6_AEGTS
MDGGLCQHQRPRGHPRPRRQVVPDLAGDARRALQGRDHDLRLREHHRAGQPGGLGAARRRQVAALLPGAGPDGERRRRHRRPRAGVVGAGLQGEAPQRQGMRMNHCTAPEAPKALHFEECHGVRVQGVTLQNGQQQHLTFTRCSNARASFLRVASPESSPGTDGIHLVNSISIHVNDIHIATGGACVSMVGNCTDVRLRYISCGPGNGISIGSIGETPVADRLEKIEVDTMFIANTSNGLLIKTWQDGCGYARKVKFANVVMKNVSDPIIIDQYRSEHPIPCGSTAATRTVAVEKIDYVNIAGTSASKRAVTFSCSDVVPCRQVSLKDVNLKRLSGRGASAYCRSASGKAAGVVVPESCLAGARAAGVEEQ